MRWFILTVAVVALLIFATVIFANGKGHTGIGSFKGLGKALGIIHNLERYADDIGLTEKQLTELKQIQADGTKKLADLRAEVEKAQVDLMMLVDDVNTKSSEIDRSFKLVQEKNMALERQQMVTLLQMREVLSIEQRAIVRTIMRHRTQKEPNEEEENDDDFHFKEPPTPPVPPVQAPEMHPHKDCPMHKGN